jgi:predicted Zn-dependent peptidase
LRKLLREKLSGTYDVSVRPFYSRIPRQEYRMEIDLGADPERIDELVRDIFQEINEMREKTPSEKEVDEIRLAESRDYETNSRQNGWWLSQIIERCRTGEDPAGIVSIPNSFALLTTTSVRNAALTYFNTNRYVQVTLYPEKK